MRLGLSLPTWGAGPPATARAGVLEADRLGLDSVWSSESYGADAIAPLAWWGGCTRRVRLGTAIAQLSAREPTATAMAALTLDHLSGGRFVLGIGASGPQVVEGWYGRPFPRPLERTREYVTIVRQVLRREPVRLHGDHYRLPAEGGSGLGITLRPILHPVRTDLPVFLAAEGPRNVALAAEIADGWLPLWFAPVADAWARRQLAAGFARRPPTRGPAGSPTGGPAAFEVVAPVHVVVDSDVRRAADAIRPAIALYLGGMGARGANFHHDVFTRMGWGEVADEVQQHYLGGDKARAAAAIPLALVEDVALVGPIEKIREELGRWRSSVVTTLAVKTAPPNLELLRPEFD